MRKRRMVAPVAATLSVAMLAAGCGGGGGVTEATGTLEDPITVQWGKPKNPLVPGNTAEVNGGNIVDAMFTGLVEYKPKNFEPYNAMAKSIDKSKDGLTYTVTLKQGWTFHNGEKVTADNFVKAWNYTAYAPNGQQGASFFSKIKGFEQVHPPDPDGDGPKEAPKPTAKKMSGLKVINDYKFTITLDKPFTIFPTIIGYAAFSPLPDMFFESKANREEFKDNPIGNGPYKFKGRTPNESLTLVKYDKYQGKVKGSVGAFKFKIYNKLKTAYQDIKSGNLDFLRQVPTSALVNGRWKKELGDNAVTNEGLNVTVLGFPLYKEKFQDPNLRKALSMAINREAIVKKVFSGSRSALHGWVPPDINGYKPGQCKTFCHYNPKKAKAYLKKAGGFQGTLTISSNADGGHQEWVKAVAGSIRKTLGINVVTKMVPTFNTFRSQIESASMNGLFRSGWVADYPSIESFLTPIYTTGASSNDTHYSNPAFDKAIAQANQAPTVQKANELYAKAADMLSEDMPSIPIYTQNVQAAKSDRLSKALVTPRRSLALTSVEIAKPKE